MISDPAESPILPGRNMLCTNAGEYNPQASKGGTQISQRLIIEIQQIPCVDMHGYKKIQSVFFLTLLIKKLRMWGITSKSINSGRNFPWSVSRGFEISLLYAVLILY